MSHAVVHRLVQIGKGITLEGRQYIIAECPECMWRDQVFPPTKGRGPERINLERGSAPPGQMPRHTFLSMPSLSNLRGIVGDEEYNAAADRGLIDGQPLLAVEFGGVQAAVKG